MPKVTAIETELLKVTKLKAEKGEDRQDFLERLVEAMQDISDDKWEKVSKPAQDWSNKAAKAVVAKKEIPEFAAPEEDEEDEDEAPAKKKSKAAAKDEEDEEEDEEDEKPAKGKKKSTKKAKDEDEEEDEEDEPPAKKKKGAATAGKSAGVKSQRDEGVKAKIKRLILAKPQITVDDLVEKLGKGGAKVSKVTVANVRAEFRHTIRVLNAEGLVEIDI